MSDGASGSVKDEKNLGPTGATSAEGASGAGASGAMGQSGPTGAGPSGAQGPTGAEGAGASGPSGASGASKVPEKYELKLPEGSPLKATHVEKIAAEAKARGLSNEEAQALLERDSELLATHAEDQQAQLKATTAKWLEDAKADGEIGGAKAAECFELSKRVVARFGTDAFKASLESTGLGNNPELVRMLYRIGKSMSEDQLVLPGEPPAQKKTIIQHLYGDGPKKT